MHHGTALLQLFFGAQLCLLGEGTNIGQLPRRFNSTFDVNSWRGENVIRAVVTGERRNRNQSIGAGALSMMYFDDLRSSRTRRILYL